MVDEAAYFHEVFRDWNVPMSPLCPFYPVKLKAVTDHQNLQKWAGRKKPIGKNRYLKNECPLCDKHFKTEDFLQFHMKTSHEPGQVLDALRIDVGNMCLAQLFCDIVPCGDKYFELSGNQRVIVDDN